MPTRAGEASGQCLRGGDFMLPEWSGRVLTRMWSDQNPCALTVGMEMVHQHGTYDFKKKIKTRSPYDPAIPLLGAHPKEFKVGS